MKKPERTFTLEIDRRANIGISPETLVSISLSGGKIYSAPIKKIHTTLARWHAKEHLTGKRRRRRFKSSEEMRKFRKEHPDIAL